MRRIGRRPDRFQAAATSTATKVDRDTIWVRIWNETNVRAKAWSRKHHGNKLNNASWLALWERVRDEIAPRLAWAVERRRGFASISDFAGEGVAA